VKVKRKPLEWLESTKTGNIVAILALLVAILACIAACIVIPQIQELVFPSTSPATVLPPSPSATYTLDSPPTRVPTVAPTPTLTPTPVCPYRASTDAESIVSLIDAEAQAVLNEDLSIIQAIFAEDAVIRDATKDDPFVDPASRYATLFTNADYLEIVHYEVQPAGSGITGSVAYFTSGSKGRFTSADDPSTVHEFENDPCSDHWTFGRDGAGCWVIINFTFNACHDQPFPPE
jgi:hypothetical protein